MSNITYSKTQIENVIVESIRDAIIHSQSVILSQSILTLKNISKEQLLGDFVTTIRRNLHNTFRKNILKYDDFEFLTNTYYWSDVGRLNEYNLNMKFGDLWEYAYRDGAYHRINCGERIISIIGSGFKLSEIKYLVVKAKLLAEQKLENNPEIEVKKVLNNIDKELANLVDSTMKLRSMNFSSFGDLSGFDDSPSIVLEEIIDKNESNKEVMQDINLKMSILRSNIGYLNNNITEINKINNQTNKLSDSLLVLTKKSE